MFADFVGAQEGLHRSLRELGQKVMAETIESRRELPDFVTKEIAQVYYEVQEPDPTDIEGVDETWVAQEFVDRITGDLNPGLAYLERPEIWEPLAEHRKVGAQRYLSFSYTYSQRMGGTHIDRLIDELDRNPHSRQLWLPVWSNIDETRRGDRRVPCSLGYQFLYRNEKLHMSYLMRSCDLLTHYPNDTALAVLLLRHVARQVGMQTGQFTHYIGSLHVFQKDDKKGEFFD